MRHIADICAKKVLLMEHYADASHLYSRAVERLLRDGHDTSTFSLGRQSVAMAKEKCNVACLALDKHATKHGC